MPDWRLINRDLNFILIKYNDKCKNLCLIKLLFKFINIKYKMFDIQ